MEVLLQHYGFGMPLFKLDSHLKVNLPFLSIGRVVPVGLTLHLLSMCYGNLCMNLSKLFFTVSNKVNFLATINIKFQLT